MANPIAVLWMITGLGCPDLDVPSQLRASAVPVSTQGSSPVWKVALAAENPGARDVSLARELGSDALAQRSAGPDVPAARPPVPFLRQPRPASSSAQPEVPETANEKEEESHDALDLDAAKAAIEQDGYKRVMMLGKASNGAWRAKAYRGRAEVALTVGSDGTVSAE